jgi:hypothetical protein
MLGFGPMPRPVVGPAGADGAPALAVTIFGRQEGHGEGRPEYCEVLILSGKDGQVKRRWRGDDGWNIDTFYGWNTATPQRVNLDRGTALCVAIYDAQLRSTGKSGSQLVLLDFTRGTVLQRRDIPKEYGRRVPFWVQDVDGDGKDEVLYISQGKLHALRGGVEHEWWTWTLPDQSGSVLEIEPARQGLPATVVVAAGSAVYGLNGATGRPRWRCDTVTAPGILPRLLPTDDPRGLPRVLFPGVLVAGPSLYLSSTTLICRQALPAAPTGEYLTPEPWGRPDDSLPPDPRLIRPLPWHNWGRLLRYDEIMTVVRGLAVLFVGLIVPGWLLRQAWRRRSGRLALLPVGWLGLLGLWASASYSPAALLPGGLIDLGAMAMLGVPGLILVLVALAAFRRRWRRLGLLLAVCVLVTLVHAGVWLAVDGRGLEPGEHYSWDGWYAMLLIVPYEGAGLLGGVYCLVGLYRGGQWLVSRVVRRVRPA